MAALAFGTAVWGAFLQVLFDKLASPALKELTLRLGVRGELDRLQSTLLKIQALVMHEEGPRQARDPSLALWLKELKYAAFDSEDVLDEIAAEALRLRMEGSERRGEIPSGVAVKMRKIQERLERIASERGHLKLSDPGNCAGEHARFAGTNWQETSSVVTGELDVIVGRREEKDELVSLLTASNDGDGGQNRVDVVAMVGVGGVGKSTVAGLVFNDEKIFLPRLVFKRK